MAEYLTEFIYVLETELAHIQEKTQRENQDAISLIELIERYKAELDKIRAKPQPQTPPSFNADEERRKAGIRKGQEFNAKRNKPQESNPQHQDDAWFKEDVRRQEERFRQQRESFQDNDYDWRRNMHIEKDMLENYIDFMNVLGFDHSDFPVNSGLEAWYAHFKLRWPALKKAYYTWLRKNKDGHLQRPGDTSDELIKFMNGVFDHINRKLFPPSKLSSILRLMHRRVTLLEAAMLNSQ